MEQSGTVFDFQATVGLTKHLGGAGATDELLALCGISSDMRVLDVGCGAGATACHIAKRYGCWVTGVDIMESMVERSIERAHREGLEGRTEFRVADAQDLPFEDNTFDIVITESVTVFPPDKQTAVSEYVRVTVPGGHVGLNETTWLKTPVPQEMVAYIAQDLAMNATVLDKDGWVDLLKSAGLQDIIAKTGAIDAGDEFKGLVQRYGCRNMLSIWGKIPVLVFKDPAYRAFLVETSKRKVPPGVLEYAGYGLYAGRK